MPLSTQLPPPLIFVVEDNTHFRELVVETLREMGCLTEAYADADSLLLRFLEGNIPDLLITDVRLPGIDGLEALETLQRRGFNVPALVMTAFPSNATLARIHQLNVAWVFDKPFDPEDLIAVVQKLFKNFTPGI